MSIRERAAALDPFLPTVILPVGRLPIEDTNRSQEVRARMTILRESGEFKHFRRGKSDTPFPDAWCPVAEAKGIRVVAKFVCPGNWCGWRTTRDGHWACSPLSLMDNVLTAEATHV